MQKLLSIALESQSCARAGPRVGALSNIRLSSNVKVQLSTGLELLQAAVVRRLCQRTSIKVR